MAGNDRQVWKEANVNCFTEILQNLTGQKETSGKPLQMLSVETYSGHIQVQVLTDNIGIIFVTSLI